MYRNIIETNQMIEYIDHAINDHKTHHSIVGGIVGTNLCKHVIEEACAYFDINEICIIEGCQDYIGMDRLPLINHMFYGDIFYDVLCGPLNGEEFDAFKPKFMNPQYSSNICINMDMINTYKLMIINDGHLIPSYYLQSIINNFGGKIMMIVDPYDMGSEAYTSVYTVTDTLYKLSPMLAMARLTYDIETRSIDKKAKGSLKEGNISKRSVGKIDDKQYITNDDYVCDLIRDKQIQSKLRKNQKFLITSNKINIRIDLDTHKRLALMRNSLITLQSATTASLYMKYRLYSSKFIINDMDTSYLANPDGNAISVKPANILHINESKYHRYKNVVFIPSDEPISQREKYSILKNSIDLTVGYMKR